MAPQENVISGKYQIPSRGKITLMYRQNTLYTTIERPLIEILNSLGYIVTSIRLDEHANSQAIRESARKILAKADSPSFVLSDHTSWQAIQNHREFDDLHFPFSHLDTLTSAAAIKSLFARLSIPPTPGPGMNTMIGDTLDAITKLMDMIRSKNPAIQSCHIIQQGLGEHEPYLFTLIRALANANAADAFPPDRSQEATKIACDQVETEIAAKIAEAVQVAGMRTTLHAHHISSPVSADDIVICDLHYWKTHRKFLPASTTLTMPLASMIAQACEHDLLPPEALGDLVQYLFDELKSIHQKLVHAA